MHGSFQLSPTRLEQPSPAVPTALPRPGYPPLACREQLLQDLGQHAGGQGRLDKHVVVRRECQVLCTAEIDTTCWQVGANHPRDGAQEPK